MSRAPPPVATSPPRRRFSSRRPFWATPSRSARSPSSRARATRPARRRAYIEALLDPLADRLTPGTYQRLTAALTLLFGIDPIVALADNSDLERERIPALLAWTARNLVDAALAEAAG